MGIDGGIPPEFQDSSMANWLVNPTQITVPEMATLAASVFASGNGLRWLEGFMWQIMFSTPANESEAATLRDVGKQDVLRLIVSQVHAGLGLHSRRETQHGDNGF